METIVSTGRQWQPQNHNILYPQIFCSHIKIKYGKKYVCHRIWVDLYQTQRLKWACITQMEKKILKSWRKHAKHTPQWCVIFLLLFSIDLCIVYNINLDYVTILTFSRDYTNKVMIYSLTLKQHIKVDRVFNKIVLNRLNWNLKWLHDKRGGGDRNFINLHSKWCILRHFKVVYKCMKKKVS
jgi:hypothetical protein